MVLKYVYSIKQEATKEKTPTEILFFITKESVKNKRLATSFDFNIVLGKRIKTNEKTRVIAPIATNMIDNSCIQKYTTN